MSASPHNIVVESLILSVHSECEANASALLLRRDSDVQPQELANVSCDDFIRCSDAVSTDDVSDTLLRYALCDSHMSSESDSINTLWTSLCHGLVRLPLALQMFPIQSPGQSTLH